MSRALRLAGAVAALALTCTGACAFIAPFPDVAPDPVGEGGSGGDGAVVAVTVSAGGGGGGEVVERCVPRAETACYAGPQGTEGVGVCAAGVAMCNDDGATFGACVGQVLPAFESCATPEDENCDGRGCTGDPVQSVALGGAGDQRGWAVAVSEHAVVVVGSASGSTDLGAGPTDELGTLGDADAFVAAFPREALSRDGLARGGRYRFSRRFADSVARGVALSPEGDVVLVGSASGDVDFGGGVREGRGRREDVVVARFDAAGAHQFSRRFGDASTQRATAVAVDSAGNAFVTGEFWGTLDFGEARQGDERFTLRSEGKRDVFLVKLDAAGNVHWARQFGDEEDQAGTGVALDRAGNIVLVGWFSGRIGFGGEKDLITVAKSDLFVAKLDPSGDHVWSKSANATNAAEALGVAVDGAGNVLVAGSFRSSVTLGESPRTTDGDKDILLIRLDENGVPLWSEDYGDDADQEGASIAVDLAGNALVTGSFLGNLEIGDDVHTATGAADAFVAKIGPDGSPIWSRSFGDSGAQGGTSVAADLLGSGWVTGHFSGAIDLGAGAVSSRGAGDAFLVQIGP